MSSTATQSLPVRSTCRVAVIWIDWYAYHLARFKGLQSAIGSNGEVYGIELVGGVGVHKGYTFRVGMPEGMPVETLRPREGWHQTGKLSLSILLVKRLSSLDPAVVLIPGYYTLPAIAAALWCKLRHRTSVLMTETTAMDHVRKGWREKLKSRLIRTLFDWAVTGGTAHDRYLLQLGFPQHRIAHFYDVVGNTRIQEGVAALRAQTTYQSHGLPRDYFLFVGRLSPEKNVTSLLQSWLAYRAAGGTWSLILAGDGPDGNSLKHLANTSPYGNEIRFLGHRSARELLPVYAFSKCFVLPSTREPWGLVVNEAMAASLPVIVSDRCGCAEDLVRHGVNGFVFNPANEAELTGCLERVSSLAHEERLQLGERSLERIARFSPQNFGEEVAAIADAATGAGNNGRRRRSEFSEAFGGNA